MKLPMSLHSVATFICVVVLRTTDVSCTGIIIENEELDQRITMLYQTVDFMARRTHQLNVDAVFGLTMVEAHVNQTLDHDNMRMFDQRLKMTLLKVLNRCRDARLKAMATITTDIYETEIFNRVINQPEIWIRPINWSFGLLGPRPEPNHFNKEKNILTYFYNGTPNETESDQCICQLADDSTKSVCLVSDRCANMLLKNDNPRGYPLTHRLLYVQIAIALGCKERSNTPFEILIPIYCEAILQDAVDVEDANFPGVSRDLICEQVLLCGMQGYTEFANDYYARMITSWPNFAGCFSSFGFSEENDRRRLRRETNRMDFDCDNHATSLGAASLSLLIRHLVETLDLQL